MGAWSHATLKAWFPLDHPKTVTHFKRSAPFVFFSFFLGYGNLPYLFFCTLMSGVLVSQGSVESKCMEGYEVCWGSVRRLDLDESLGSWVSSGRDRVVLVQSEPRGTVMCCVCMTEKWDLGTRHRPTQNVMGDRCAETVLVSGQALSTEHRPPNCSS